MVNRAGEIRKLSLLTKLPRPAGTGTAGRPNRVAMTATSTSVSTEKASAMRLVLQAGRTRRLHKAVVLTVVGVLDLGAVRRRMSRSGAVIELVDVCCERASATPLVQPLGPVTALPMIMR
jgi:hypothetical protein